MPAQMVLDLETLAEPDVIDGSEDLVGPATPSGPPTVMYTDAFMLLDVVAE